MNAKTIGKYTIAVVSFFTFVGVKLFLFQQGMNHILAAGIAGGIVGGIYATIVSKFFPEETDNGTN